MRQRMMRMMIALVSAALVIGAAQAQAGSREHDQRGNVKNVIVMVPDGCSASIQTLARWIKDGPLHLDALTSGTVMTYMADSIIRLRRANAFLSLGGEESVYKRSPPSTSSTRPLK